MIIKCLKNNSSKVSAQSKWGRELISLYGNKNQALEITIGETYVVYAIEIRGEFHHYYIADDVYSVTGYPVAHTDQFFEVIDSRVSHCWTIGKRNQEKGEEKTLISFKEWVKRQDFYKRLINGEDSAKEIFDKRKKYMDLEFPNPGVDLTADIANEDWLICPVCDDAWKSKSMAGMVTCSECGTLLNNPRYKDTLTEKE